MGLIDAGARLRYFARMNLGVGALITKLILPRALLGLVLFFMIALGSALGKSGDHPEVGYATVTFLVGMLVLASLGIPRIQNGMGVLIIATGLLIMSSNHLLNALYGYDWFEGLWYFTPNEIRYLTYGLLGFILAKEKGIRVAALTTMVVALLDIYLGWAALLPTQLGWHSRSAFSFFDYTWNDVPRLLFLLTWQGIILGIIGLGGAILAKIPWRRLRSRRQEASTRV